MLRQLVDFLNFWSRINVKYRLLNSDEDRRDTSVRLGVSSVLYSVFGVLIVGLCAFGFLAVWSHFTSIQLGDGTYDFPFFSIIGMIMLVGIAVIVFFHFTANSITLTAYQFRLNRMPIRWVALVVLVVSAGLMLATGTAVVVLVL